MGETERGEVGRGPILPESEFTVRWSKLILNTVEAPRVLRSGLCFVRIALLSRRRQQRGFASPLG